MERLTFDPPIIPNGSRFGGGNILLASEPHALPPAATHGGTRMNRISVKGNAGPDQSRCSSRAGHTKIFYKSELGADPRARPERLIRWSPQWLDRKIDRSNCPRIMPTGLNLPPAPAGPDACDIGGSAPHEQPCPPPWPDTVAGHARIANAGPPAGRPHCNTAPADVLAGTAARTPSTSTADAVDDAGQFHRGQDSRWRTLEHWHTLDHAEAGPREVLTPKRSSRGAERLFRPATLFTTCLSSLHPGPNREPPKPRSNYRNMVPLAPRNWYPLSPPPTFWARYARSRRRD